MKINKSIIRIILILTIGICFVLIAYLSTFTKQGFIRQNEITYTPSKIVKNNKSSEQLDENDFFIKLAKAAEGRTKHSIRYNPAYVKIAYPGGDVPMDTGVCTDVVIRSYRKLGIDLQVKVHEDMKANFMKYPKMWRLMKPDPNIDHRRVPNLMTFFKRHGTVLEKSPEGNIYFPGDIVTWDLGGGVAHIGIVSTKKEKSHYFVVHNIGAGPQLEDVLFNWKITGHYRYKENF
ncbi:MAG: DUF1287 domain-containing protein [Candidatus Aureabacteria bacterium]|nr:DUF1287 domain-containing protein [Candidatus Auribacterota bacterium]